jgi:hypothetical protein
MTQRERKGWFIVAAVFLTLVLLFGGGYDTVPVFLPALLRGFPKWSRAEVSLLPSVLALSAGLSVLPVGWLLDRIEARIVIIAGALLAAGSFFLASAAHSLATMMGAYLILGLGISAGTVLPASLVLANWFTERRGLAMGIALSGSTVGGSLMTLVAGHLFQVAGWRSAYLVLGLPMLVVVVPLVAFIVRSRPPGAAPMTVAESAELLEGFETGEALRTRSFWLIVLANFCFAFSATGSAIHGDESGVRLCGAGQGHPGICRRPADRAHRVGPVFHNTGGRPLNRIRSRPHWYYCRLHSDLRNVDRGPADAAAVANCRITRAQALRGAIGAGWVSANLWGDDWSNCGGSNLRPNNELCTSFPFVHCRDDRRRRDFLLLQILQL